MKAKMRYRHRKCEIIHKNTRYEVGNAIFMIQFSNSRSGSSDCPIWQFMMSERKFIPNAECFEPTLLRLSTNHCGMDHFSHDPSSSASHRHEDSNAESTAAAGTGTGPPHKRSRLSHDVSSPSIQEPHSIERRSPATSSGPRRAAQACLRCRKQKLRCLGGKPCARCIKADRECDFGKPGQQPGGLEDANGSKATLVRGASARLENLESSVANLLAGLSRPGIQQGSDTSGRIDDGAVNGNWSYPVDPLPHPPLTSFGTAVPLQQYQHIPPQPSPSSLGDSATVSLGWQGDFAELQAAPSDTGEDPGSSSMSKGKSKGKGVEPEERLAVATQDEIQPPFKALVFHVSIPPIPLVHADETSRQYGKTKNDLG
jgi:hypothetical protein